MLTWQVGQFYSLITHPSGSILHADSQAYEIDPTNEIAANNLELLRNSINYPKRARGDLKAI